MKWHKSWNDEFVSLKISRISWREKEMSMMSVIDVAVFVVESNRWKRTRPRKKSLFEKEKSSIRDENHSDRFSIDSNVKSLQSKRKWKVHLTMKKLKLFVVVWSKHFDLIFFVIIQRYRRDRWANRFWCKTIGIELIGNDLCWCKMSRNVQHRCKCLMMKISVRIICYRFCFSGRRRWIRLFRSFCFNRILIRLLFSTSNLNSFFDHVQRARNLFIFSFNQWILFSLKNFASTNLVQFVIQTTSVTNWFAVGISSPECCWSCSTIRTLKSVPFRSRRILKEEKKIFVFPIWRENLRILFAGFCLLIHSVWSLPNCSSSKAKPWSILDSKRFDEILVNSIVRRSTIENDQDFRLTKHFLLDCWLS